MDGIDILKRRVSELENLADEIEILGKKIMQQAPVFLRRKEEYDDVESYYWEAVSSELREVQHKAVLMYQRWYTLASQLVKDYLPERSSEFSTCYATERAWRSGIMSCLQFTCLAKDKNLLLKDFMNDFDLQRSILSILPDVAEIKESNFRKKISTDIARSEIEQAERLLGEGYDRAAGCIAGIALELHLRTLCDVNGISYSSKATIQPFLEALDKVGKLDKTEKKYMEYLASIRNKCSHPNDVTKNDVKVLIDGVKKLV